MKTEMESGIAAFFARDHDEIDLIFGRLREDLKGATRAANPPYETLAREFDEFNGRLERHIRWEEEILFPAVEEKSPSLTDGPGRVMRMEHVEIRRLKAIAEENIKSSPTPEKVAGAAEAL
jgi:hemerythrin-like domain-containing protein